MKPAYEQAAVEDYFPWHDEFIQRALSLRSHDKLPQALIIESASASNLEPFLVHLCRLLLCEQPADGKNCDACDPCRMMKLGTFSDYKFVSFELDPRSKKFRKTIVIDQIRALIDQVNLTSRYSGLKIVVIYPAEKMNIASANALLKTLEEPSAKSLLILATHNKGRLPVTTRSRCQSWRLDLPPQEQAISWLLAKGLETSDAANYLEYAQGDPSLALELQQQNFASLLQQFKSSFAEFLRGSLNVSALSKGLLGSNLDLIRRLLERMFQAYIYRNSGIDKDGNPLIKNDRQVTQALLELRAQSISQLRTEENNLDFQLQLEDVLISLKKILSRRAN